MYARLLVRSVVSLALYSGRCLDVRGGGGSSCIPGGLITGLEKKNRFKTIDMAVLIKTRFEFTGF